MLVVGPAAVCFSLITGGEGRAFLALQVGGMVVVQGEPLLEVLWQFPLGVKPGQPFGAGLLPGAGVLVAGLVEQLHRLAGEEEAVLASFGHAPDH